MGGSHHLTEAARQRAPGNNLPRCSAEKAQQTGRQLPSHRVVAGFGLKLPREGAWLRANATPGRGSSHLQEAARQRAPADNLP
jgi:hypothetical protein